MKGKTSGKIAASTTWQKQGLVVDRQEPSYGAAAMRREHRRPGG